MVNDVQTESWELPFGDDERPTLDLEADAFRLSVEAAAPGEAPRLEARGEHRPEVRVWRDGSTVHVRVEHAAPGGSWLRWLWAGPPARLVLRVPANVRARLRANAGKLRVQDLSDCELDLGADAGAITLHRVRGRVRVGATAGTVEGRELSGSIDAETEAGSIRLRITALDPGTHRLRAEAGSISVELARGIAVRVDARATMGSARVEYPTRPDAEALLDISASAGSVRVREALDPVGFATVVSDATNAGPYRRASPPGNAMSDPTAVGTAVRARDGAASASPATGPELERVLELVAQGKLSPADAGELLRALGHR